MAKTAQATARARSSKCCAREKSKGRRKCENAAAASSRMRAHSIYEPSIHTRHATHFLHNINIIVYIWQMGYSIFQFAIVQYERKEMNSTRIRATATATTNRTGNERVNALRIYIGAIREQDGGHACDGKHITELQSWSERYQHELAGPVDVATAATHWNGTQLQFDISQ